MAEVFGPPEGFPDAPEYVLGESLQELMRREDEWVDALAAKLRSEHEGDLVGKVLRFPWADGYALYMVAQEEPLWLVILPLGDSWRIQEFAERGMSIDDVRLQVEHQDAMDALFGGARR